MIKRIHHAQLTIESYQTDEARQFYCGVLGLKEVEKPDSLKARGGFWVQIADQQIHIGIQEGVDRYQLRNHIAYQVDDIEAWRTKLEQASIEFENAIPVEGWHRIQCRDPFGNRMEFVQILDDESLQD